jgi:tyrosine-protein kinase Etk/Wzc
LARQYEVAKVDEARQGSIVQTVDRAIVPDKRSFPLRSLIVLGAAIFGLIVGIFWVLAKEEIKRLSNTPTGMIGLESLKKSITSRKKQPA